MLLGKPVEQVEDLAKLASPVYQVDESDPPILIMLREQDNQVPVNQLIELKEAYDELGLDASLIFFEEQDIQIQSFLQKSICT